ncbi:hypothetical protein GF325_07870|nr:hypothetical protein [Candidatus Bathyarchaeota archaeon]
MIIRRDMEPTDINLDDVSPRGFLDDKNHVFRTTPNGERWRARPPAFLYQNVMWPMGSTPGKPSAHASSIIKGPLEDGIQTLYSTFHWGPGEGQLGEIHALVRIWYDVDRALKFARDHRRYPADPADFDPFEPNENPMFNYDGPHVIADSSSKGRCHGNSSPYWDPATGTFHLWYTTFVPGKLQPSNQNEPEPRDIDPRALTARRIFYKFSTDPEPWTDLGKWSEPVEWSDQLGLWARSPPVVIDDGGDEVWLIAHNDETTWMPEFGNDWTVRFAISTDKGKTWEFSKRYGIETLPDPPMKRGKPRGGIIQPSVVQLSDGSLYCLCRSHRGYIVELRSVEGGRLGLDWTTPVDTMLPNNNSGICQSRLTTDAKSNDHLMLIYNPVQYRRTPVSIAESLDGGKSWRCLFDLRDEQGELSYPWILQTADGLVHCTYTLHRMVIEHDVFLP